MQADQKGVVGVGRGYGHGNRARRQSGRQPSQATQSRRRRRRWWRWRGHLVVMMMVTTGGAALEPLRQIRPVHVAAQSGSGHGDQRLMGHNLVQLGTWIWIGLGLLHFDGLQAQRQTGGGRGTVLILLLLLLVFLLLLLPRMVQLLLLLGNLHIQRHFVVAFFGLLLLVILLLRKHVASASWLPEHHPSSVGGQCRCQLLVTGPGLCVGNKELQVLRQVVLALPSASLCACQLQGSQEAAPDCAPSFAAVAYWKILKKINSIKKLLL